MKKTKKHKILIADDNNDMVFLLKRGFEREEYQFIHAGDGIEALEKIKSEKPDLILLDLKMPRKDGMEVLKDLKQDTTLSDIPVIVLTVVSETDEKIKALHSGASDFLVKPPDPVELRARVNTQLKLRDMTRSLKIHSQYLEKIVQQKTDKLKQYAKRLEEMVEQKVGVIKKQNQKLLLDLKSAQKVQRSLLPSVFPSIGGVEFYSGYFPCQEVGGDFYDVFRIDEKNVGIFISDVSGHGVPSAMITIFLKQELQHHIKEVDKKGNYKLVNPDNVLKGLNQKFIDFNIGEDTFFVTMIYAIYSSGKNQLTVAGAGHHALPIIKRGTGETHYIELNSFPVGWFRERFECPQYSFHLERGDRVLFYTDGLLYVLNEGELSMPLKKLMLKIASMMDEDNFYQKVEEAVKNCLKIRGGLCDDAAYVMLQIK